MSDRDSYIYLSEILLQTTRVDDSIENIKKVIEISPELNKKEIHLLTTIFKNAITSSRNGIYYINSLLENDENNNIINKIKLEETKLDLIKEIVHYSQQLIDLIENKLIIYSNSIENTILYYKLIGDFCRYQTEFLNTNKELIIKSSNSYLKSLDLINKNLSNNSILKFSIILNYSVQLYEIENKKIESINLLENNFELLKSFLSEYNEEELIEAKDLLKQIENNLNNWKN